MTKKLTLEKLTEKLMKDVPRTVRELSEALIEESDRGMVLVCAETLNLELERLFRTRFPAHVSTKLVNSILKGPLHNFATRISLAFALGYFGEPIYLELERLRSVRNKFAHSSGSLKLASALIAPLVAKFENGRDVQKMFLENKDIWKGRKESSERWFFLGAFFHIRFALQTSNGTARSFASDLIRIKKEYFDA